MEHVPITLFTLASLEETVFKEDSNQVSSTPGRGFQASADCLDSLQIKDARVLPTATALTAAIAGQTAAANAVKTASVDRVATAAPVAANTLHAASADRTATAAPVATGKAAVTEGNITARLTSSAGITTVCDVTGAALSRPVTVGPPRKQRLIFAAAQGTYESPAPSTAAVRKEADRTDSPKSTSGTG